MLCYVPDNGGKRFVHCCGGHNYVQLQKPVIILTVINVVSTLKTSAKSLRSHPAATGSSLAITASVSTQCLVLKQYNRNLLDRCQASKKHRGTFLGCPWHATVPDYCISGWDKIRDRKQWCEKQWQKGEASDPAVAKNNASSLPCFAIWDLDRPQRQQLNNSPSS